MKRFKQNRAKDHVPLKKAQVVARQNSPDSNRQNPDNPPQPPLSP